MTIGAGPSILRVVRVPAPTGSTWCSRASPTLTASTRQLHHRMRWSTCCTSKSTPTPNGPCTRPRLPARTGESAQSTPRICGDHSDHRSGRMYLSQTRSGAAGPTAAIVRFTPAAPDLRAAAPAGTGRTRGGCAATPPRWHRAATRRRSGPAPRVRRQRRAPPAPGSGASTAACVPDGESSTARTASAVRPRSSVARRYG